MDQNSRSLCNLLHAQPNSGASSRVPRPGNRAPQPFICVERNAANAPLDGGKCYRLRVPPNVPAKQFWAATAYDLETAAFLRESFKTEVNSYQDLQKGADASV